MNSIQSTPYHPPIVNTPTSSQTKFTSHFTTAKVLKIAFVAIATLTAGNVPKADAGPLAYAACVGGCTGLAPPFFTACLEACLPLLAAPGP